MIISLNRILTVLSLPLISMHALGQTSSSVSSTGNVNTPMVGLSENGNIPLTRKPPKPPIKVVLGNVNYATPYTFTTFAGTPGMAGSTDGTGGAARFDTPISLAVDAAGNVYVGDLYNYTIRKINPAGEVTTLAGSPGIQGSEEGTGSAAKFWGPGAVAVDQNGNVYFSEPAGPRGSLTWKVTPAGKASTFMKFSGGLAFDQAGNIYHAHNNELQKLSPSGVTTMLLGTNRNIPPDQDFQGIAYLAVDRLSSVYFFDSRQSIVFKYTSGGALSKIAGTSSRTGNLYTDGIGQGAALGAVTGLAVDAAGNVYVACGDFQTIRMISPTGDVTTLAGSPGVTGSADGIGKNALFNSPVGLALDQDGNIYIADKGSHTIRKGKRVLPAEKSDPRGKP